jgi:hypothetical protein
MYAGFEVLTAVTTECTIYCRSLLILLIGPEDGGSIFLRNACKLVPDYIVTHPRSSYSSITVVLFRRSDPSSSSSSAVFFSFSIFYLIFFVFIFFTYHHHHHHCSPPSSAYFPLLFVIFSHFGLFSPFFRALPHILFLLLSCAILSFYFIYHFPTPYFHISLF